MKNILFILASAFIATSVNAFCDTNAANNPYFHRLYVGADAFAFDLHTHVKDVNVHGVRGLVGPLLRYEYLKPKAFYAGVDLLASWANKNFKPTSSGYTFHGNGGMGFGNLELRLGYTFERKRALVSPFAAVGFYGFGNTALNELLLYGAAGMRSLFAPYPSFSMGLNLKLLFAPSAELEFKYNYEGHQEKLHENENMWGGEIGIPFVWHLGVGRRWEILFEPYFLKLDFSQVQNIYGTRLLFGHRF